MGRRWHLTRESDVSSRRTIWDMEYFTPPCSQILAALMMLATMRDQYHLASQKLMMQRSGIKKQKKILPTSEKENTACSPKRNSRYSKNEWTEQARWGHMVQASRYLKKMNKNQPTKDDNHQTHHNEHANDANRRVMSPHDPANVFFTLSGSVRKRKSNRSAVATNNKQITTSHLLTNRNKKK